MSSSNWPVQTFIINSLTMTSLPQTPTTTTPKRVVYPCSTEVLVRYTQIILHKTLKTNDTCLVYRM